MQQSQGIFYSKMCSFTIRSKPLSQAQGFDALRYILLFFMSLVTVICGCGHQESPKTLQLINGQAVESAPVIPAAYQAYLQGQVALLQGDLPGALQNLEMALSYDPSSPYLYTLLAEVKIGMNKPKDAQAHLDQALRLTPGFPDALLLQGRLYWQDHKLPLAEARFKQYIQESPKLPSGYLLYAELLERTERANLAEQVLKAMARTVPDASEAHHRLALLCLRQVDYSCANRYLSLLLQNRSDPETLVRLAHVKRATGQTGEAIRLLREAFDRTEGDLSIASILIEVFQHTGQAQAIDDLLGIIAASIDDTPEQMGALAEVYLEAEKPTLALSLADAQLKKASEVLPVPAWQLIRAEALAQLKKTHEAKTLFQSLLAGPQGMLAALRLSHVFRQENKLSDAYHTLRQALERHGQKEQLVLAFSDLLFAQGQPEQSVAIIREALVHHPQSRKLQFALGTSLERIGYWREAIEAMRQILRQDPQDAPTLNFVGYTQVEHGGDLNAAEKSIRRALFIQPGEGYIIDSLGWLYFRQGHVTNAHHLLGIAYHLTPKDPEVLSHLAEVKMALKDPSTAFSLLTQALQLSEDQRLTTTIKTLLSKINKRRVGRR